MLLPSNSNAVGRSLKDAVTYDLVSVTKLVPGLLFWKIQSLAYGAILESKTQSFVPYVSFHLSSRRGNLQLKRFGTLQGAV